MSYVIPPAEATEEQVDRFIESLRSEARDKVREMLERGAPEDEIVEYLETVETAEPESPLEAS